MNLWLTILVIGLLTFAIRASLILLFGRLTIPDWLNRLLRYVPPAVLSAIILPDIFIRQGNLNLDPANPRLISAILAGLVAWRTRSVVLTLLAGLVTLVLAQLVISR